MSSNIIASLSMRLRNNMQDFFEMLMSVLSFEAYAVFIELKCRNLLSWTLFYKS